MEKQPCSIFNDVIGPVMRGPSSSHVAGAARIADLVRQAMPGKITHVLCDFDPTGALAASHTGHGTDMGFACGLLGIPLSNPQVDRYEELAKEAGLSIEYRILEYGAVHPGNYRIQATDDRGNCRHFEAVALGGGMIEMQKYEGHPVQVGGDYYEVLILSEAGLEEKKFSGPRTESELRAFRERAGVKEVVYLKPVLPTLSGENAEPRRDLRRQALCSSWAARFGSVRMPLPWHFRTLRVWPATRSATVWRFLVWEKTSWQEVMPSPAPT